MTNSKDMKNQFDCQIYVTSDIKVEVLREKVSFFLGSKIVGKSFIETCFYELSIRLNEEYSFVKEKRFPDGFLFFKFIVDIGFISTNSTIAIIEVSKLLKWFWENDMPAIVACDYEELLPYNGGYKSKFVPWPI
jgi:hypothetical protein